jgi:hypothetical protein
MEKNTMKRIAIIAAGLLLTLNLALASEPTPANQKWLATVEKMVAEGQNKVSTPDKDRIELLKDWAKKKGYTVEVASDKQGFNVVLSKPSREKLVSR